VEEEEEAAEVVVAEVVKKPSAECFASDISPSGVCALATSVDECERTRWPSGVRNSTLAADGITLCHRTFPYQVAPCNNFSLWPPHDVPAASCSVAKVVAGEYRKPPCDNVYLPDFITTHEKNVTIDLVNSTTIEIAPARPTFGTLLALRLASKGYLAGDVFYAVGAVFGFASWRAFARERDEEYRKSRSVLF
jgi:hypothetical protein